MKKINPTQFKLAKNNKALLSPLVPKSPIKMYWKRFFSSKTSIIALVVFLTILLFLVISSIVYPYSNSEPINQTMSLNRDISSLINSDKTIQLGKGFEIQTFEKYAQIYPNIVKVTPVAQKDLYIVEYNPYELMNKINNTTQSFNHLLGTNSNGVDIFARLVFSQLLVVSIGLLSLLISWIVATFLAILIALYFKKPISNFINKMFGSFAIVPYLFISIIAFIIFKPSFINSVIIFATISFFALFVNGYQKTIDLLKQEYINSDLMVGFSNWSLLTKTLFIQVFNFQLIQLIEHFSLILMSYSAVSIFSINPSNDVNLGTIIKESIDLFIINPSYLISITIITTSLTFSIKFIGLGLSNSYQVKGEKNA